MALTCYVIGQRYYPIPYTLAKDLVYILITYGLIVVVNSINLANFWANVGFHFFVLITFCGVIFLMERKSFSQPVA
jgi:hypothetical protein